MNQNWRDVGSARLVERSRDLSPETTGSILEGTICYSINNFLTYLLVTNRVTSTHVRIKVKVKVAQTQLPSVGFRRRSRFLAVISECSRQTIGTVIIM